MNKFNSKLNGYDKNEVDRFVNEVTTRYSTLLDALKEKDREIDDLTKKNEYYAGIETTMNKAIFLAEDSSNQIKKLAREESQSIIENAKKNASRIINEALIKADKVNYEADEMKRRVAIYKRKVKSIIEEQITQIDEIEDINF